MIKAKVWRIVAISVLGISILSGCNKAKDMVNNIPNREEIQESSEVTKEIQKEAKEVGSIEDLYFDRYNYDGFVKLNDPNATLSIPEGKDQVYKVGEHIQPGMYMAVRNNEGAACVTINEDGNLGDGDTLFIDLCDVNCIFELKAGQYLVAHGCNIYDIEKEYKAPMDGDAYLPGMFKVGAHIPEGEYVAIGAYPLVKVYNANAINDYDGEEFDEAHDSSVVFEVKNGQYLKVESGMIYPIDKIPSLLKERETFSRGIYKVGVTIPAGSYTAKSTAQRAKVQIFKSNNYDSDTIISSVNVEPEADLVLEEGQYVIIYEAELSATDHAKTNKVKTVEKGTDIIFDSQIKPILSVKGKATYKVGAEIQPGEYILFTHENGNGYMEITDEAGEIVSNSSMYTTEIIHIKQGQNALLQDLDVYSIDKVPYIPKKGEGYLPGQYKVGVHIPAGEYLAIGDLIILETYSDNTFEYEARKGKLAINNHGIITLEEGQYLEFGTDGNLYPIDKAPSIVPEDGVYKSGMYKVGTHIPAGTYECIAAGTDGYVVIYKDSKNSDSSELSTTKIEGKSTVTLVEGQYVGIFGANATAKK